MTPTPDAGPVTQVAREALVRWLGPAGDAASIEVESVEPVTWSNGCLDIVRADRFCTQTLVEGYRVQFTLGMTRYEVRTDSTGNLALWAPDIEIMASFAGTSPNFVHLTTDDGGSLDVQAVPGSDFGVNPSTLSEGDSVGVGVVDARLSGGTILLVWLDPVVE